MFQIPENSTLDILRFALTRAYSEVRALFFGRYSHLVVCGYPRSGTSLLYNMLSSTVAGSMKFTSFENYFIHSLHKLGDIATKAPLDVLHIDYLDQLNIHNKKIFLLVVIRDIRDIITSRHPIYPDEYFIGYDHSYWPQNKDFTEWSYDAPGVIEIASHIRKSLNRPDAFLVRYEDLVDSPDDLQKSIQQKFDIHFNRKFSDYHLTQEKHAYKYEGRFKPKDESLVMEGSRVKNKGTRWNKSEHKDRIKNQFERCPELFDLLIEYGYEKDSSWIDAI